MCYCVYEMYCALKTQLCLRNVIFAPWERERTWILCSGYNVVFFAEQLSAVCLLKPKTTTTTTVLSLLLPVMTWIPLSSRQHMADSFRPSGS